MELSVSHHSCVRTLSLFLIKAQARNLLARDLCACVFLRPREGECSRLTRETARPREDKVGRKREQRRQALAKCGADLKVVPYPMWRAGAVGRFVEFLSHT